MKGFQTKCLKKLNKQKIVIIVNIQILIGNVKFISDTNFLDFSRQKNYNTSEEKTITIQNAWNIGYIIYKMNIWLDFTKDIQNFLIYCEEYENIIQKEKIIFLLFFLLD